MSYIRTRKLILGGYELFFDYVWYICDESLSLDSIPVDCDFLSIFHTNIPGLPSKCDIESIIGLELET